MPLPPYSRSVYWKDYQIGTPTFQLSPIEKPDMSPFLFHMTGKNELVSILSGKNTQLPSGNGFLKACIPESDNGTYDAEVVCFTESPTFALDFFRYRSFRRWTGDQRFGIGFDKSQLVDAGVRPCVYADEELKKHIIHLKRILESSRINDEETSSLLKSLLIKIYPLTTPLLESDPSQGFMWEREWRYSDPKNLNGLVFRHSLIRVICCPEEEEPEIREILAKESDGISFVRSWKEYDEVTSYLKRKKSDLHIPREESHSDSQRLIKNLKEQLKIHKSLLSNISNYQEFTDTITKRKTTLEEIKAELEENIDDLQRKIDHTSNKI